MDKSKITKMNGNIAFEEDAHIYYDVTNPDRKFVSVTTLIHSFTQPFDKDFWSAYKALEKLLPKADWTIEKKSLLKSKKFDKVLLEAYDISEDVFNKEQQAILDAWDEENRRSCERGTKIHAELENSFYKKAHNIDLAKYQIGGKFECIKNHNELDLENGVYPEYLISRVSEDGKLCLAGQIDLLIKKGNKIIIGDWKGLPLDTEIPTLNGWSTIAELQEGDIIFDKDGKPTKIVHKSEIHHNPCYKITFDTGESIIADHEHRWLINFETPEDSECIMTTEELSDYLKNVDDPHNTPKILNPKPLQLNEAELPIDPYVLGCQLGSAQCGNIEEIYSKTNNIPLIYQRASYEQRLSLLRGLMDTCGYYDQKMFVMEIPQDQQCGDIIKLLSSLGIIATKATNSINFTTSGLNPFLKKNQEIECPNNNAYRSIDKVELVETVPTQCLEVDSPTHTFLCTDKMIVTHNTNKKIDTKSFYDKDKRSSVKMKYPLNNLDDVNFYHYTLQLSTYAWMIQKLNPDFVIEDLVLVHFDHDDNMTVYHLDYLKDDVERMLAFYKKQSILAERQAARKRIEY